VPLELTRAMTVQNEGTTSTLFIAGFASNVSDREMENFCRFIPGFVGAKSSFTKGPKVWVRFDSNESAAAALPLVHLQPVDLQDPSSGLLNATFARTEMNPTPPDRMQPRKGGAACILGSLNALLGLEEEEEAAESSPVRPAEDLAEAAGGAAGAAGVGGAELAPIGSSAAVVPTVVPAAGAIIPAATTGKRPRSEVGEFDNDTLCILAVGDKGLTEESLANFFAQLEGYMTLRVAPAGRGGGNAFVKFETPELARAALEAAAKFDLDPQMARTSLNVHALDTRPVVERTDPGETLLEGAIEISDGAPAESWSGLLQVRDVSPAPAKRQRVERVESAVVGGDTLCIMGLAEKGLTEKSLNDFFAQLDGFVALRYTASGSGRGGGSVFAKFADANLAQEGLQAAASFGLEPQIARSSLNPQQATFVNPTPE